jgi:(p)ppGpp synthase/HD superfamily hydrolase
LRILPVYFFCEAIYEPDFENMQLSTRQNKLLVFVQHWHADQQRKYEPIPYWHHLVAVAELVNRYEKTEGAIEIALCHDLLEDTPCTISELKEHLTSTGYAPDLALFIEKGVIGMTDVFTKDAYPHLNRRERKKQEAARLGHTPAIVHSIKYADMTDNARSIVAGDRGFAAVYLHEMTEILNQMRMGNIHLLIDCCVALDRARQQLSR